MRSGPRIRGPAVVRNSFPDAIIKLYVESIIYAAGILVKQILLAAVQEGVHERDVQVSDSYTTKGYT